MPKKKVSKGSATKKISVKSENKKTPVRSKSTSKLSAKSEKVTEKEKQALQLQEKTGAHEADEDDFYVAAIGASAGGLEALEQFFKNMPPDSGIAFIVVPHLAPDHDSLMPELLQRHTKMEVTEAKEQMKIRPDHVYVIPPNRDMSVHGGRLDLMEPAELRGYRHPIDIFFRSLAEELREKSIGIILSGTGSEGAVGLRHIKGEGGLAIAQDLKSARYSGMPESAIGTGIVDKVLPPGKIPEYLIEYIKFNHPLKVKVKEGEEEKKERSESLLQQIFGIIQSRTGHDFSMYKQNTIRRRIEKRLAIHQMADISAYVKYLRSDPHEADSLAKELLIRVTGFFRDAEAFRALKEKGLPAILEGKDKDDELRVWVPGCSTGEEAYSIAILIREKLDEMKAFMPVHIFATDIDENAIDVARRGFFPETISVDVSEERLEKFFRKQGSSYRIRNSIREMLVFAVQSISKDPPFRKMDLVSCRNLLIYMNANLQKKILPILRYSLKPGGILFLGTSESVGERTRIFSVVDKKWRIFRARGDEDRLRAELADVRQTTPHAQTDVEAPVTGQLKEELVALPDKVQDLLLEHYSPASVIVNEKGNIIYFYGKTGKYLEPASGRPTVNAGEMAREGMKLELLAALRKAANTKNDVSVEGVRVKTNGDYHTVDLRVKYIRSPRHLEGLLMVIFEDRPPVEEETRPVTPRLDGKAARDIADLEFELKTTKENLQTTIEELETSNEELTSTNEELQSSNEELQSTNEELETSREELQSLNEELFTVNTELQEKIEDVSKTNNDMKNLLASTRIATIFLNMDKTIKNFTPSSKDVMNIIEGDVGRSVGDLTAKLDYPDLLEDVSEVIDKQIRKEKTVRHQNGQWYIARIMPYLTVDNEKAGAIMTFVDITALRQAEENLRDAIIDQALMRIVTDPLLVLSGKLEVIKANDAFYKTFKVEASETENKLLYELGNGQWDIPELRKLLSHILAKNNTFEDYPVEHKFPKLGRKKMLLDARSIFHDEEKTEMILLRIKDVTGEE